MCSEVVVDEFVTCQVWTEWNANVGEKSDSLPLLRDKGNEDEKVRDIRFSFFGFILH
jgi:hypothetical protein